MDKIFDVAIIGIGEQTWDNLLPSLASMKNVNIKAVCDIDTNRVNLAARNYGAEAFTDINSLIEAIHVDAVVVASHPNVHKEVLEICIPKGIPIFVEKPPTLYTHELEKLVDLNKKYNTITSVGFNFNFADPVKLLKEMLLREDFGRIEYVRVSHLGSKPNETMWGLTSKARSFLLAQAIHPLGLLLYLGAPVFNETKIRSVDSEKGMVFDVNMLLEDSSKNTFVAELLTTSLSPFFEWQLQLLTSKGVLIYINSLWEVEVHSTNKKDNTLINNPKWWRDTWRPSPLSGGHKRNGYENHFKEFFENIQAGKQDSDSIEHTLNIYYLIDEMEKKYESTIQVRK